MAATELKEGLQKPEKGVNLLLSFETFVFLDEYFKLSAGDHLLHL